MIHIQKENFITTITIDRPKRKNAIDRDTAAKLEEAFHSFEMDEQAKIAILTGAKGTFCAGADLKEIAAGNPNRLQREGRAPLGPSRMLLSKPVIAAISGYAVAGGLELALWCDLRIVEEDAIMGVFCRRWGVPLIDGGTVRLPRLIGLSRAMDLILTGREVTAEEALSMGLVNRIVPKGCAYQHAKEIAQQIISFPQQALLCDRMSAYEQFSLDLPNALRMEFERGMDAIHTKEAESGAQRFVSQRAHSKHPSKE
jgi:enoyl-CoA hydratase